MKDIEMQVLEAQRVPNKMAVKTATPRHIVIKMPEVEDKERLLKAVKEVSYLQGSSHKTVS